MNKFCPICNKFNKIYKNSFPYHTTYHNIYYEYYKCSFCSSIFLKKNPSKSQINKMYDNSDYHKTFYEEKKIKLTNNLIETFLNKYYNKNNIRICDFGCGNGSFLNQLSNNYDKYGVEYSEEYLNYLTKKNKNIKFISSENFLKDNRYINYFDVIFLSDVLEHLPDQYKVLNKLEKYLSINGSIIIEGPVEENYNLIYYASLIVGFIKKKLNIKNYFPPYHLVRTNHFSQKYFFKRLKNMMIKNYYTFETGWPYRNNGLLRSIISIINDLLYKKNDSQKNNRFLAILVKKNK